LIGRLGASAESRFTESGSRVVNLRVATNEYRKGEDGERTEITDWHRVVVFGRLAELCADLAKGRLILVEGKPKTRKFTDREGQERESHEVIADRIEFLSRRLRRARRRRLRLLLGTSLWAPARVGRARTSTPMTFLSEHLRQ